LFINEHEPIEQPHHRLTVTVILHVLQPFPEADNKLAFIPVLEVIVKSEVRVK
jgi:hypothetical protein